MTRVRDRRGMPRGARRLLPVKSGAEQCKIPVLALWSGWPLEDGLDLMFISVFARSTRLAMAVYFSVRALAAMLMGVTVSVLYRGSRQDVYNILWLVVFGFATLNILSLAARRVDPARRGMSFGEVMAVAVVVLSVFLLAWELLNLLHIFPIQLKR